MSWFLNFLSRKKRKPENPILHQALARKAALRRVAAEDRDDLMEFLAIGAIISNDNPPVAATEDSFKGLGGSFDGAGAGGSWDSSFDSSSDCGSNDCSDGSSD